MLGLKFSVSATILTFSWLSCPEPLTTFASAEWAWIHLDRYDLLRLFFGYNLCLSAPHNNTRHIVRSAHTELHSQISHLADTVIQSNSQSGQKFYHFHHWLHKANISVLRQNQTRHQHSECCVYYISETVSVSSIKKKTRRVFRRCQESADGVLTRQVHTRAGIFQMFGEFHNTHI